MPSWRGHAQVSPSSIRKYEECAHAYWLERIKKSTNKRKRPVPPYFLVGRAVHKWLEVYTTHLVRRDLSRDKSFGVKALDKALDGCGVEVGVEVAKLVGTLLDATDILPEGAYTPTYQTERKVALTIDGRPTEWGSENAKWRGILDAHWQEDGGETLVIYDWKTNRAPQSQTKVLADQQLAQYAWAISCLPEYKKVKRVDAYLYFVRYHAAVGALWPRKALTQVGAAVRNVSLKIARERDWLPNVGPACAMCGVRNECVQYRDAIVLADPLVVQDAASADKAARMYAAMGVARTQLGEQLREYIDGNGPIVLGDHALDVWVDEYDQLHDLAGLVKRLDSELGVSRLDLWKALKLNKKDVVDLLKRAGLMPGKAKKTANELYATFGVKKLRPIMEVRRHGTKKT